MKKILLYIALPLVLAGVGCSDWLNVSPRVEVKQDDLYASESGFRSALIGAYIKLAGTNLYGKNTSYYFQETLSRNWTLKSNTSSYPEETALGTWSFTNSRVESKIATIWKEYYSVVVHLNNILDNIDKYDTGMASVTYNLIKGECYGLRAFVHLDVLRLFGPMPESATNETDAIPYVTNMTKEVGALLSKSYGEVIEEMKHDLDSAEYYLGKSDPLLTLTNPQLNYMWNHPITEAEKPLDDWFYYRQRRFNYYAVKGTKARMYHWIGDKTNAARYAREVIDSEKFRLTNNTDYTSTPTDYSKGLVMLSEHLFGLHNQTLPTTIILPFSSPEPLFTQTVSNINKAYENHTSDTRLGTARYWEEVIHTSSTVNHFRKYGGSASFGENYLLPMLRLSEMYLILMEDLPYAEIAPYWSALINARNLPASWLEETESNLAARLEKEYRKEFYGEGQMFFFYKRHSYTRFTYPSNFTVPANGMVIPIPESQTVWDEGIIVMD